MVVGRADEVALLVAVLGYLDGVNDVQFAVACFCVITVGFYFLVVARFAT